MRNLAIPDSMGLVSGPVRRLNRRMTFETAQPQAPANAPTPAAQHAAWLVAVGQKQDRSAFAELFAYYAPRIKSFLMKGGAAPDIADEMAQETMLAIWQKAAGYDPAKAGASTWIFTIARNKRIDSLRKRVRPETGLDDFDALPDPAAGAGEIFSRQQETDAMALAMESLPPEQSDLLYKSFFEDKTHADIAAETKLPLGTVKSRIRMALEKLRGDGKVRDLWT